MKEFTVTYLLDDDEIARLEHIKTLYDRYTGTSHDIKKIFAISMIQGCAFDIKSHLDLLESGLVSLLARDGGEVA